jgi:hypothetical protein
MSNHTPTHTSNSNSLTEYDVVLLDHTDLDEFITAHKLDTIPEHVTIFTDDNHTRNTFKLNLIVNHNDSYGIATQLHHPVTADDTVLDLRDNTNSFADYLSGTQ